MDDPEDLLSAQPNLPTLVEASVVDSVVVAFGEEELTTIAVLLLLHEAMDDRDLLSPQLIDHVVANVQLLGEVGEEE